MPRRCRGSRINTNTSPRLSHLLLGNHDPQWRRHRRERTISPVKAGRGGGGKDELAAVVLVHALRNAGMGARLQDTEPGFNNNKIKNKKKCESAQFAGQKKTRLCQCVPFEHSVYKRTQRGVFLPSGMGGEEPVRDRSVARPWRTRPWGATLLLPHTPEPARRTRVRVAARPGGFGPTHLEEGEGAAEVVLVVVEGLLDGLAHRLQRREVDHRAQPPEGRRREIPIPTEFVLEGLPICSLWADFSGYTIHTQGSARNSKQPSAGGFHSFRKSQRKRALVCLLENSQCIVRAPL